MELTLYQYPSCPFCARVRTVLEAKNIPYKTVNVARSPDDPERKMVIEKSKCSTVPVLHAVLDSGEDVWMGESGDIIAFLEERFS